MKIKRIIALLLCIFTVFATTSVYAEDNSENKEGEAVARYFDDVLDYVQGFYKYDVTREELLQAAVSGFLKEHPEYVAEFGKGAFEALDENSKFYIEEEFTAVYEDVTGNYVGIGIYVSQEGAQIVLGEPIKGAPAENSGLRVGDVIKAVDGVDVTDFALDKVTSLIKGEAGTKVDVTVMRNGAEYTYTLTRAEIHLSPITYNVIEGTDAGYIKISSFNDNTGIEFYDAVQEFHEMGIEKIILDVRNNRGGSLNQAIFVASFFVPDGEIIVTKECKNPENNVDYRAVETPFKLKAVVLVNQHSASASELVSSAIRDYKSGILVGKRTYGKGSVQEVVPLIYDNYLWMTTAEYFTPSHTPIHKVGLEPDYITANTTKKFDMSTLEPYDSSKVYRLGDQGENIRILKDRLRILGYTLPQDDVYDTNLANAITEFQKATELFPYGVADITTQMKLNDVLVDMDVEVDKQYELAVELLEKLK